MSNGKEKMYDIAEKGLGGIRTLFKGSRLGGGPGWLGYGTGQWAPGANIGDPTSAQYNKISERRGILGRLADKKALDQWGTAQGPTWEDDIYEERLSKPNNLMQLLLGKRAKASYGGASRHPNVPHEGPSPSEYFPQEDPRFGSYVRARGMRPENDDGSADYIRWRRLEEHRRMMESGMTPEDRYRENSGEYDW